MYSLHISAKHITPISHHYAIKWKRGLFEMNEHLLFKWIADNVPPKKCNFEVFTKFKWRLVSEKMLALFLETMDTLMLNEYLV